MCKTRQWDVSSDNTCACSRRQTYKARQANTSHPGTVPPGVRSWQLHRLMYKCRNKTCCGCCKGSIGVDSCYLILRFIFMSQDCGLIITTILLKMKKNMVNPNVYRISILINHVDYIGPPSKCWNCWYTHYDAYTIVCYLDWNGRSWGDNYSTWHVRLIILCSVLPTMRLNHLTNY